MYKRNGQIYEGEFKNDLPNGKGILYQKNINNVIYKGDFVDGYYDGNGKLFNKEGGYYKGQFVKGERAGFATIYDENKDIIYQGNFKNQYLFDYDTDLSIAKLLNLDKKPDYKINKKKNEIIKNAMGNLFNYFLSWQDTLTKK